MAENDICDSNISAGKSEISFSSSDISKYGGTDGEYDFENLVPNKFRPEKEKKIVAFCVIKLAKELIKPKPRQRF